MHMCLDILYQNHKEWIRIIKHFGEKHYAEDIVQETYIKIYTANSCHKAIVKGKINTGFVWIALRNNFITFQKEKAKGKKIDIEQVSNIYESPKNIQQYISNDKLEVLILKEMTTWDWYDSRLFRLYIESEISMRNLSAETGISFNSIANTIKKCKEKLRKQCGEDYEDYCNADYDYL